MQDTIIKGAGNSRSIKSVPNLATLAPTYEKLLELLTGSGLPVDIGGLNPTGVQQTGTELSKANLLSDATETAIWGDFANRTPDQALKQLLALITNVKNTAKERARIAVGTYAGTGTAGSSNPNSLTFSFAPQIVFIAHLTPFSSSVGYYGLFFADCITGLFTSTDSGIYYRTLHVTWSGNTMQWYSDMNSNPELQLNNGNSMYNQYKYFAIG